MAREAQKLITNQLLTSIRTCRLNPLGFEYYSKEDVIAVAVRVSGSVWRQKKRPFAVAKKELPPEPDRDQLQGVPFMLGCSQLPAIVRGITMQIGLHRKGVCKPLRRPIASYLQLGAKKGGLR